MQPKYMLDPDKALARLREYYANVTAEQFKQDLIDDGTIEMWTSELPWVIVQRGSKQGGVFQIIPTKECHDNDFPSFFGKDVKEFFKKSIPTVVDYFSIREEAERFLNQFSEPVSENTWPANIEEPLRQWYEDFEHSEREQMDH